MSQGPDTTCRRIECPQELEAVARLRYRVFVEELGRGSVHADRARGVMRDPLDAGAIHLGGFRRDARHRDVLIAALRILVTDRVQDASVAALYGLPPGGGAERMALVSRLVTEPSVRGGEQSAGLALARFAYRVALEEGAAAAMIDCERRLEEFFVWLGFDVTRRFDHTSFGPTSVLRLDLFDETRLARTRSPFAAELAAHRARTLAPSAKAG